MIHNRCYKVLLLPTMETAARHCTLAEAEAWMRAYNLATHGPMLAVVTIDSLGEEHNARQDLTGRATG